MAKRDRKRDSASDQNVTAGGKAIEFDGLDMRLALSEVLIFMSIKIYISTKTTTKTTGWCWKCR